MPGSQFVVLVAVAVGTSLPTMCFGQSRPSHDDGSAMRSLHVFLEGFDREKDRYTAAFVDLNSDGKPEAIVYLTSSDWCGVNFGMAGARM